MSEEIVNCFSERGLDVSEFVSSFPLKVNDNINGYTIEKVFQPGATAYLAIARQDSTRQLVFLKKYRTPGGRSPWFKKYIEHQNRIKIALECDPVAKSISPEVVEFFVCQKPGLGNETFQVYYQVFELLDSGNDLRHLLNDLYQEPAQLTWEQRCAIAKLILAAVKSIHEVGVIHTDLKPENIYLVTKGDVPDKFGVKLIDFDVSILDGALPPWQDHIDGYFGTEGYQSPEHFRKTAPVKASDVFTTAIILSELVGEGHPARGSMPEYQAMAVEGRLKPFRLGGVVPNKADRSDFEPIEQVINAALNPDPSCRPTSEQMYQAFSAI